MVDDACSDTLVKYCKANNIVFKVYPTCFKNEEPVANPTVNRRKKIPRKPNDNVISDHETSTSCSEGSDDEAYIKRVKSGDQTKSVKSKRKGSIPAPLAQQPLPLEVPATAIPNSTPTETQIPETPSQAQI